MALDIQYMHFEFNKSSVISYLLARSAHLFLRVVAELNKMSKKPHNHTQADCSWKSVPKIYPSSTQALAGL